MRDRTTLPAAHEGSNSLARGDVAATGSRRAAKKNRLANQAGASSLLPATAGATGVNGRGKGAGRAGRAESRAGAAAPAATGTPASALRSDGGAVADLVEFKDILARAIPPSESASTARPRILTAPPGEAEIAAETDAEPTLEAARRAGEERPAVTRRVGEEVPEAARRSGAARLVRNVKDGGVSAAVESEGGAARTVVPREASVARGGAAARSGATVLSSGAVDGGTRTGAGASAGLRRALTPGSSTPGAARQVARETTEQPARGAPAAAGKGAGDWTDPASAPLEEHGRTSAVGRPVAARGAAGGTAATGATAAAATGRATTEAAGATVAPRGPATAAASRALAAALAPAARMVKSTVAAFTLWRAPSAAKAVADGSAERSAGTDRPSLASTRAATVVAPGPVRPAGTAQPNPVAAVTRDPVVAPSRVTVAENVASRPVATPITPAPTLAPPTARAASAPRTVANSTATPAGSAPRTVANSTATPAASAPRTVANSTATPEPTAQASPASAAAPATASRTAAPLPVDTRTLPRGGTPRPTDTRTSARGDAPRPTMAGAMTEPSARVAPAALPPADPVPARASRPEMIAVPAEAATAPAAAGSDVAAEGNLPAAGAAAERSQPHGSAPAHSGREVDAARTTSPGTPEVPVERGAAAAAVTPAARRETAVAGPEAARLPSASRRPSADIPAAASNTGRTLLRAQETVRDATPVASPAAANATEPSAPAPAVAGSGADLKATPASGASHDAPWRQEPAVPSSEALPESAPPLPVSLPPATSRRVQESVLAAVRSGRREVSLELEPASLGRLRIRLQVEESKVGVELVAANAAARTALEMNQADLSRSLSDQGLELGRFSVSLDDGTGRQAADRHAPETTPAGAFDPAVEAGAAGGPAVAVDRVALGMNRVDRVA